MRKLIVIALLAAMAATPALAFEYPHKYYGHVQAVFPSGDWSDFANLGYGPGVGMIF